MAAIPKPQRRVRDPHAGVEKLQREDACRACGRRPSGYALDALNRAHLVPKGQGGDDVDANIVPVCGSGTSGCHGMLTSHATGWEHVAAQLRSRLTPAEELYVLAKKGRDWLDRTYPEGGA